MKKTSLKTTSYRWGAVVVLGGFILMLFTSLVAYRVESRYSKAYQQYTLTQQGRIDQLERMVKQKEEEIQRLKSVK